MKAYAALAALACAALPTAKAHAHAEAGGRIFPVTLTIDDPGVEDEASLPVFQWSRQGADGGPGPTHEFDFNFDASKRITPNFGIGVSWGWTVLHTEHDKTRTGFQNLEVTGKYQAYVNAEHEFVLSVGVSRSFGRTGTSHIGAEEYGSTIPTVYFGKGLGDLPIGYLRPLAVTGVFGFSISDKGLKGTDATDPITGVVATEFNHGAENRWTGGLSLQYSLPYLQSSVKDLGLPQIVSRFVPVIEMAWSSPATAPSSKGTQLAFAPGIIYSGDSFQAGIEAVIPATRATGSNVGVIAQFHVFFDELFPTTLGKPIFE